MGMSADAHIAWGIDLGDDDSEEYGIFAEKLEEFLEDDDLIKKVCGFDEPFPVAPIGDAVIKAWRARMEAAVPVSLDHYGTCEYGGQVLVISRTLTRVNWGCDEVVPISLVYTEDELAKLNLVLDALEFKGDRTPKLLLWAMYG